MAPEVRTVLTTAPDRSVAEELVGALVEERLAACGTVLDGAVSIYRWQGQVERADEALIILKTGAESAAPLRDRIVALHPYEVPEVLILGVEGGHLAYLDWVIRESGGRANPGANGP